MYITSKMKETGHIPLDSYLAICYHTPTADLVYSATLPFPYFLCPFSPHYTQDTHFPHFTHLWFWGPVEPLYVPTPTPYLYSAFHLHIYITAPAYSRKPSLGNPTHTHCILVHYFLRLIDTHICTPRHTTHTHTHTPRPAHCHGLYFGSPHFLLHLLPSFHPLTGPIPCPTQGIFPALPPSPGNT